MGNTDSDIVDYQDCASGTIPSQADYTIVRDYLLTLLCINDASRADSLGNIHWFYVLEEKAINAVQISKYLTKVMHVQQSSPEKMNQPEEVPTV